MRIDLERLKEMIAGGFLREGAFWKQIKLPKDSVQIEEIYRNAVSMSLIVGVSYLSASLLSSILMVVMVKGIMNGKLRLAKADVESSGLGLSVPAPNFRDLKRIVVDRNMFNSEGKVPDEKFEQEALMRSASTFRLDAPCTKPTLNIELVGTIYLGTASTSLATVREKGYDEADIYKVGDQIIGQEGAFIAAVERNRLIINNKGVKECFDLSKGEESTESLGSIAHSGGEGLQPVGGGKEVVLDSPYVESELGPGFGKIIDAARFVPNTSDNAMNGFKIFAIKPESLLARVGLQNGDVITQVNDTSLKLPEQGFAFYQALQDEKEVRLQILRNGTTPTSITIRIK